MKMTPDRKAIDKMYRRRDRYDIPDWQRDEVWDLGKKQRLIDSILRGWKLPKFYFIKATGENFLVEDGQQRLTAIWEFFGDEFELAPDSATRFGAANYSKLPRSIADAFDDFEIEFDVIEDATDPELKEFFQRLQEGVALTSSEKLNAVDSKLRDFCKSLAEHPFFKGTVAIANTRFAHFDVVAKVATVEIEGPDAALRFADIRDVFVSQSNFSPSSAVGLRIKAALDLLQKGFKGDGEALRTRTIVQSLVTLTCKLVGTGKSPTYGEELRRFFEEFMTQLAEQVEKGAAATDLDYVEFQRSVNANVKGGAKTRQQILLRKLLQMSPVLTDILDPSIVVESGMSGHITTLGESISNLIVQNNSKWATTHGEDLFKATGKTTQALLHIRNQVTDLAGYESLIDDLYFLFRESVGERLAGNWPIAFNHVNDLRTDLRHDVDHGKASKVRAKRRRAGATFKLYAGGGTPDTLEPAKFILVQANLLSALERELRTLLQKS